MGVRDPHFVFDAEHAKVPGAPCDRETVQPGIEPVAVVVTSLVERIESVCRCGNDLAWPEVW